MKIHYSVRCLRIAIVILSALACASGLLAQTGTGSLRGQVTDPSGAGVQDATVQVTSAAGQASTAKTNRDGSFEVKDLAPGRYTVEVAAKDFAASKQEVVEIAAGRSQSIAIALSIQSQEQQVTVSGEALTVDVTASNNASSVVMSAKDLDALSDDPDELQADLEALAGPSSGPNGGQMYIDGFTAGQLPPKSSIREVRINQNPFSSEYDKVGYGRIEIFTRPGTDKWHSRFEVNGNSSVFNARNPFAPADLPPYHSTQFEGSVGGPLNKHASFFVNAEQRNISDTSVVNTFILDPNFQQVLFSDAVPSSQKRLNVGPRLDYQLGPNNTLSLRYQFVSNDTKNNGIGPTALASTGYNSLTTEHTLQLADTQVFGSAIVNETRFQYVGNSSNRTALNAQPTISVLGAFTGGGNAQGNSVGRINRYELQNYTSVLFSTHLVKAGARLRAVTDTNTSTSGMNGTFTFPSLNALAAGSPNQFSLVVGSPKASVNMVDAGLYFQDDWHIQPKLTFSYGLRFETQNHISNHADWAPRLALAWGIGRGKSAPKTVLRTGIGLFYDRFAENLILEALRQNGVIQQQYIVANPVFYPNIPSVSTLQSLSSAIPTVYQTASNLRAPLLLQAAVTLERQLSRGANVSVSYLNSRGYHQLLTNSINTPLPGTYNPFNPQSGVRPNGILENIYEYQSRGIYKQQQLIVNVNVRTGPRVRLNGFYRLAYANSDVAGGGGNANFGGQGGGGGGQGGGGAAAAPGFPSDPYNILADYGRASFDVRHRVFLGGTIALPYALQLSPFLVANSGTPYNITIGQDLIGSSRFNQRAGIVSPATCAGTQHTGNIYCTPFGTYDIAPNASETLVPINSLTGPNQFSLNLRLSKTFSFGTVARAQGAQRGGGAAGGGFAGGPQVGPEGPRGGFGGGDRGGAGRYNVTLSVNARNVFNNVNLATPIGNLNSPQFGTSNSLAGGGFGNIAGANRQITLQMALNF